MILTRRRMMEAGGGILAGFIVGRAAAADVVDIVMRGRADGSHVWFDPTGVHIQPGQTVRWTNRDPGNSHTVTSYHPDIFERPLRIPAGAKPWNSDYLLPNESFSQTFTSKGSMITTAFRTSMPAWSGGSWSARRRLSMRWPERRRPA